MASKNGLMERSIQGVLLMDRRKAEENFDGLGVLNMLGILCRERCKVNL